MNIVVTFVFPHAPQYLEDVCRFIATYAMCPAGIDHRLIVVSNGGPPTLEMRALTDAMNHTVEWYEHDNSGFDIGAEQAVAHVVPCDMMVFFGATAYIRGPGWLKRMAEAFERWGPANLYGCMGNDGDSRFGVFPHIRTTGYFLAPTLMNMYPLRVTRPEQRYPAEHGPGCLTQWFKDQGHRAMIVTWDQEYEWPWDRIPNGFHQGNQSALLTGDKNSAPPYYPYP
jgi:hypothetical protein